jgi:protein KRI1
VYYKDLARQALTEDNKPKKTIRELHDEEQAALKKSFKMAADDAEDEGDLFKVKAKTQQQIEDENKEFAKFLKTESKKSKQEEVDMLQRFWGDESKLDDTDKFLRKYIMTNGYGYCYWIEVIEI